MRKFTLYIVLALAIFGSIGTISAQERPRLVINIVMSSMHRNDITRYANNYSTGGFRLLSEQGVCFSNASYNYMQTTTPVSLATISTGAMPSTHGIISDEWFDYINNKRISLIEDSREKSLKFSTGSGNYSAHQLLAQTLTDALHHNNPQSKIATIAINPLSAIVMNGHAGEVYWMESQKSHWTTSTCYTDSLPEWVEQYNKENLNQLYQLLRWNPLYSYDKYHNCQVSKIEGLHSKSGKRIDFVGTENIPNISSAYHNMCYTPAGNTATLAFAKQLMAKMTMGKDEHTDILNIVLDTPEMMATHFGPESVEYEDMMYRLDKDLEDFIIFAQAQVGGARNIIITLTAAHGSSPSYNSPGNKQERFNVMQAEVIINAFLGAQYGNDNWVLGYIDRNIYLNHNLIYEKKLSVANIQHDVATFAMQLRGVSHAIAGEALRNSYFGSGYAQKIQNGFYPKRSGDVIINLMPGWVEEQQTTRSLSGSMYLYDTEVPLIIYGNGLTPRTISEDVDMTYFAPTLAHLIGIAAPTASEGKTLNIK